jgi:hypothetical protein
MGEITKAAGYFTTDRTALLLDIVAAVTSKQIFSVITNY